MSSGAFIFIPLIKIDNQNFKTMETKIVNPKTFFYSEGKTTLNKIHEYADREMPKLLKEMEINGLKEDGPMEFIYLGVTDELDKEFILRISVPVKEEKAAPKGFHFSQQGEFKCVSTEYKGDVGKMFPVYEMMYNKIYKDNYHPKSEIREVYHLWENPTSERNITEIQIGIN